MVIGLVSHTRLTDIGMLLRTVIARQAANSIWKGMGIKAAKIPTAMAREAEWRLRCQRLGSCSRVPKKRKDLCSLMRAGSGMKRFIKRLGMGFSLVARGQYAQIMQADYSDFVTIF